MENAWTKRIEELTESRDHWKREWSLLNAGLNMAEDRIKELAAENKRLVALNDTFPQEIARLEDRVSAEYEAERADDRARIKGLEAERDADRKREYGYSQQTVDALTVERDKLEAENAALKEYRTAEARRRAELYAAKVDANWCLKNEIEAVRKELAEARLEIDKRDHWIKARDTLLAEARREVERIKKVLELGCQDSESVCPYWINMKDFEKENEHLEAENKRLRELVDGARVIVEVFQWSTPAQERWREEWLKKAAKALKEASHD